MVEFLKHLFDRLEQAPIAAAVALIIFLIAAPLILRIWRATGPAPPATPIVTPPALEQTYPWIGIQLLHQTEEIAKARADIRELADKVAKVTAAVDGVVALVKARRRHRPSRHPHSGGR